MAENIIEVAIGQVNVHGRFRKEFGDIPALAQSIADLGLLQPIGIDSGYRLVFGERRLRAFQHLGRDKIPARFVNLDSLMKGELAENEFRLAFTPSERVAIGEALEQLYSPVFQDSLAAVENPYGRGGASQTIVVTLERLAFDNLLKKRFYDLPQP